MRVALTSSIIRATATLNRCDVDQLGRPRATVRWVTLRSVDVTGRPGPTPGALVDVAGQPPGPLQELAASRAGDTSAQSMSSSGGPANTMVSRTASTPYCVDLLAQVDAVAQRLAHRLALVDHLALVQQRGERLDEVDHAHVVQHLGEEPRVQQVQDRVLDAADVLVDRHPAARPSLGSNGPSS